jgi:hypothetical protein
MFRFIASFTTPIVLTVASTFGVLQISKIDDDVKILATKYEKLQRENRRLAHQNKKLSSQNSKLSQNQKRIRAGVISHRQKMTKTLISRGKSKIASAPAKAIPFLGTATIIAMTTLEIQSYCDDIKEMDNFEKELFGSLEKNTSQEEEVLCNYF